MKHFLILISLLIFLIFPTQLFAASGGTWAAWEVEGFGDSDEFGNIFITVTADNTDGDINGWPDTSQLRTDLEEMTRGWKLMAVLSEGSATTSPTANWDFDFSECYGSSTSANAEVVVDLLGDGGDNRDQTGVQSHAPLVGGAYHHWRVNGFNELKPSGNSVASAIIDFVLIYEREKRPR